jgi:hypothetical protein
MVLPLVSVKQSLILTLEDLTAFSQLINSSLCGETSRRLDTQFNILGRLFTETGETVLNTKKYYKI